MKRVWLYAWLLCLLAAAAARAAEAEPAAPPAGILLLTSYHQGDAWNDRLVQAFLAGLPAEAGPVYIEYLDSRRLSLDDFAAALSTLLARKYARIPIRLLVASDDPALDFWLAQGPRLFPGRPLVFCGINDFNPERIAGRADVTGVSESPDVLGTLELGLALLPRARTIVALGDDRNSSGQATLTRFRRAMRALGPRVRAVELLDLDLDQTRKALAALPRDAIVLRLANLISQTGLLPSRDQSTRELLAASPVPLLALWDYDFGSGALGGRLVNATSQGRAAAELAARVLAGQPPATLPVVDGPNQAQVDFQAMARFGIPTTALPAGVVVVNEPPPAFARYKSLFWSAGVALAVLLPVSLLLILTLAGRQEAERRLRESESRYRELVESARCLILRFDRQGRLTFVNEYAERLLGDTEEALTRLQIPTRQGGPANLSGMLARAMLAPGEDNGAAVEHECLTRDGRTVTVHWENQVLHNPDGSLAGALIVGTDITVRRRAEEALASRILMEEALLSMSRYLLADGPDALERALCRLLSAFAVDRAVVMENYQDPDLGRCCRLRAEAFAPGLSAKRGTPGLDRIAYSIDTFRWADTMEAGEIVCGPADDFPETIQELLAIFQVRSVVAAPILRDGVWWGFLALGDTRSAKSFDRQAQGRLILAAGIVGAYLARPGQRDTRLA